MTDPDMGQLLAEAQEALDADIETLAGLDDNERQAIDDLTTAASPEDDIDPHADTGPHLTDEEWAYVLEVSGG